MLTSAHCDDVVITSRPSSAAEAADRPIYAVLDLKKVDAGVPDFGPVGVVFNRSSVGPATAFMPADTGGCFRPALYSISSSSSSLWERGFIRGCFYAPAFSTAPSFTTVRVPIPSDPTSLNATLYSETPLFRVSTCPFSNGFHRINQSRRPPAIIFNQASGLGRAT